MKKTTLSRRKFIGKLSTATGAVALLPGIRSMGEAKSSGKLQPLSAREKDILENKVIKPVRVISRLPGSHILSLARRPF
jgi:hypothetical protein